MKCCNNDDNEDGNCHIHSAPGRFRRVGLGIDTAGLLEILTAAGRVLWLDDIRTPLDSRINVVRTYAEFVAYLEKHKGKNTYPRLMCFDHDLAAEHYPKFGEEPDMIPYHTFKEKTGKDCAEYIRDNELPLEYWSVHSASPRGRRNIEGILYRYDPGDGWLQNLEIPYTVQPIPGVTKYGYRTEFDDPTDQEIADLEALLEFYGGQEL